MKIGILGFGREGQSVLKFLESSAGKKRYPNAEVFILDKNHPAKTPPNVKLKIGKNYLANLETFDLIFRSPGIRFSVFHQLPE